jgi:hypothetical protein
MFVLFLQFWRLWVKFQKQNAQRINPIFWVILAVKLLLGVPVMVSTILGSFRTAYVYDYDLGMTSSVFDATSSSAKSSMVLSFRSYEDSG